MQDIIEQIITHCTIVQKNFCRKVIKKSVEYFLETVVVGKIQEQLVEIVYYMVMF